VGSLPSKSLSKLVSNLALEVGARTFVETGTYRGDTAAWAAEHFTIVHSIEICQRYIDLSANRLRSFDHVQVHKGDTRTLMREIVALLTGPTVFWLDAHSGGGFFGDKDDCPLLHELAAISAASVQTYVFIDDARGFTAPPPPPYDFRAWPDLKAVLDAGYAGRDRFSFLHEDVIAILPPESTNFAREELFRIRPKLS